MKRAFRLLAGGGAILFLIAAGALGYAYHHYTRPGPLAKSKNVVVPKGANLDAVAGVLAEAGVIDRPFIFKTWVRILGRHNRMRAGEFRFPHAVSQQGAIRILIRGKMVLRRFTALEGHTTSQVLDALSRHNGLRGPITAEPAEGDLLPDTYFYVYGDSRNQVVQRMSRAMTRFLDKAWAKREQGLPIKTKREALILASIIEKETSKVSEMRRVAAVFVNRLRRGMKLESDPTAIYGITKGKGPLGRRLLTKDVRRKHPYNTYLIKGLPPGPIANPGRNAILAALSPLKTKELYFVADGTGGHAFAETLRQHINNVNRWRKIRRRLERRGKR